MSRIKLQTLVAVVALSLAPLLAGAVVAPVGEVTLTIGKATIRSADHQVQGAVRGLAVRPGDSIETESGGHVHIRFLDGAMVSVRPLSRLIVEIYSYAPDQVAQSQVRFRLEKGATRAISGAAAEGAKERFRLNTPLVAIGVRGTDFVVQTDATQSNATVSQGAILVAPLGEGCATQALGPCNTQAARLLSAEMGGVLVAFSSGLQQPEIRPNLAFQPTRAAETPPSAVALNDADRRPMGTSVDASALATRTYPQAAIPDPVNVIPIPAPEPVLPQPVQASALSWGRWGAAQGASDISIPREQARAQGQALVYGWPYSLYRQQSDNQVWSSAPGKVGFALQGGTAQYKTTQGNQPITISSGSLVVDYGTARYSTQLQLAGVPYALSTIAARGTINKDGVFETSTDRQTIAGAVTFDAAAAAYMFQKAGVSGIVSGITQWGR